MDHKTLNSANILSLEWTATHTLPRELEIEQRKVAQQTKGHVVLGSGVRGKPRSMAQMVSVRLEPLLLRKARSLADHNEITLSEVLREALRQL